ncbi:golgin subfamily B member 1-like isoform X3 [Tribolium madens]|uniref:golgin subfamily B member 1-like isoform X3 n=1 Tax=Tribolium madens TaxID=41895 RepID=UPI001CF7263B|nr:golgin subfamily B member 1-like isoform X3 [Tribolium madens]
MDEDFEMASPSFATSTATLTETEEMVRNAFSSESLVAEATASTANVAELTEFETVSQLSTNVATQIDCPESRTEEFTEETVALQEMETKANLVATNCLGPFAKQATTITEPEETMPNPISTESVVAEATSSTANVADLTEFETVNEASTNVTTQVNCPDSRTEEITETVASQEMETKANLVVSSSVATNCLGRFAEQTTALTEPEEIMLHTISTESIVAEATASAANVTELTEFETVSELSTNVATQVDSPDSGTEEFTETVASQEMETKANLEQATTLTEPEEIMPNPISTESVVAEATASTANVSDLTEFETVNEASTNVATQVDCPDSRTEEITETVASQEMETKANLEQTTALTEPEEIMLHTISTESIVAEATASAANVTELTEFETVSELSTNVSTQADFSEPETTEFTETVDTQEEGSKTKDLGTENNPENNNDIEVASSSFATNYLGPFTEQATTLTESEKMIPNTISTASVVSEATASTSNVADLTQFETFNETSTNVGTQVHCPESKTEEFTETVAPQEMKTKANLVATNCLGPFAEQATTLTEPEEIMPNPISTESVVAEATASTANVANLPEFETVNEASTQVNCSEPEIEELIKIIATLTIANLEEQTVSPSDAATLPETEEIIPKTESLIAEESASTGNVADLPKIEAVGKPSTKVATQVDFSEPETGKLTAIAATQDEPKAKAVELTFPALTITGTGDLNTSHAKENLSQENDFENTQDLTLTENRIVDLKMKFLASPKNMDNELYRHLLESSPSVLNHHLPSFQKYSVMKLEVNNLRQKIAKLTLELLQKERELIKIRPDIIISQPIKLETEYKELENGDNKLDEAYKKIANLSKENTKYANDSKELQNKFDTALNDFSVLKENYLKLENELQSMKEDNVKLRENLRHYDVIMEQLCKKIESIQVMYDKELEKRTRLENDIQKVTEERFNKASEMADNKFKRKYEVKILELANKNIQLTEMLQVLRSKMAVIGHDKENKAEVANK